jgi:hypothetical protein
MVKAYLLGNVGNLKPSPLKHSNNRADIFDDENVDEPADYNNSVSKLKAANLNFRQGEIIEWVQRMEHIRDLQHRYPRGGNSPSGRERLREWDELASFTDSSTHVSNSKAYNSNSNHFGGQKMADESESVGNSVGRTSPVLERDTSTNEDLLKWRYSMCVGCFNDITLL